MIIYIILILIVVFLIIICFKSFKENEFGMFGYNIAKVILRPIIKFYYPYKIINKKNIPKDGAVIFCGNHLHVVDQCLPLLCMNRPVHYMAKKEYFDSKKVSWFFKMVGCIPVDREIHDENAKDLSRKILEKKLVLGLFPEGTRNQVSCKPKEINKWYPLFSDELTKEDFILILKCNKVKLSQVNLFEELYDNNVISKKELKGLINADENLLKLLKKKKITLEQYKNSLLLPLKYGAVSLAKKTNATIVPFAIVGDYKFRSKNLKVVIGDSFKVEDMTLKEANEILYERITKPIIESSDINVK